MDIDMARRRPYKTGELARLFGVSQKTIIRWIDDGRFGAEGKGWRWTSGGPGSGDRLIAASAVHRLVDVERNP